MDAARFLLICQAGGINRNQQDAIDVLKAEVRVINEHLGPKPLRINFRSALIQ